MHFSHFWKILPISCIQGVAGDGGIRRRIGESSSRGDLEESGLVRPKLNLNQPLDRDEEERKLKSLLR